MRKIITLFFSVLLMLSVSTNVCAGKADYNESTGQISVKGSAGKEYAEKDVTMLMYNGELTKTPDKSNIKYIEQFKTDSNGDYSLIFPYKKDIAGCTIYMNCGGKDITFSIENTSVMVDGIKIEAELRKNSVQCLLTFGKSNERYTSDIIYAAYDKEQKLLKTTVETVDIPEEGTILEREIPIPENTDYVKVFVWENFDNMIPKLPSYTAVKSKYIKYRASAANTFAKLSQNQDVTIAFFGGSVTDGYGASDQEETSWRARVGKWFKQEYPSANINLVNAAMGGTGSRLGMYRLQRDIISKNPDMVFIMFSINDVYAGESQQSAQEQMETVIYDLRTSLPETDIIILYDIDQGNAKYCRDNNVMNYPMVQYHENVAEYYGITSINIGKVLADSIDIDNEWSTYVKDVVHPLDSGYKIYADTIINFLKDERSAAYASVERTEYTVPEKAYQNRISHSMIELKDIELEENVGWEIKDNKYWSSYRYALCSEKAGDYFTFKVKGKEINMLIYGLMSGDPIVDYTIDGVEYTGKHINGQHPLLLAKELEDKEHTVTIKNASDTEAAFFAILYR